MKQARHFPMSHRWSLLLLLAACWASSTAGCFSVLPRRSPHAGAGRFAENSPRGAESNPPRAWRRITTPPTPGTCTSLSAAPSSPSRSATGPAVAILDLYSNLDVLYNRSTSVKCPFFRRRFADTIDSLAMLLQFLLIRHKSLPGISDLFLRGGEDGVDDFTPTAFSAPGCKAVGRHVQRNSDGTVHKARHLSVGNVAERIRSDWADGAAGPEQGYYITGKLNSAIYRDDCLFVGPDPDMPVRGLRKYLSAASQLFDQRRSFAELLSIDHKESGGDFGRGVVEVRWRLGGVLMLPWHPTVEPWTGWTRYHLDEEEGLVCLHEEGWDISVWQAFVTTAFPRAREWPWVVER